MFIDVTLEGKVWAVEILETLKAKAILYVHLCIADEGKKRVC